MKHYNSIPYYHSRKSPAIPFIAFDKIDGSNIRFEWNRKKGFYKFGKRQEVIQANDEQFGKAVELFKDKYADELSKIFNSQKYSKILSFVCFAEFHGLKSAFGQHENEDEHDITLFDISAYKKGFIFPKEFIDNFGHIGIPKVIYNGELTSEFVSEVYQNKFDLKEGVICKGIISTRKGNEQLHYCKIKTNDWFERLRKRWDEARFKNELKQAENVILQKAEQI